MDVIVRKPTEEDIEYIIEHIRPEDAVELDALDGSTIRESLDDVPDLLNVSQVWEVDGKPVCIFGITPQDGPLSTGVIWMLATIDFHKYLRKFSAYCRKFFQEMISEYSYLFNYIHSENKVSIRWLKSLGFDIHDAKIIGHKGASFHKFELKNV